MEKLTAKEDEILRMFWAHGPMFIQDLLVDPEHRRKGVGTALLKAIQERFRHVRQMHLVTDDTPETAAFYQAAGFTELSEAGCLGFTRI